MTSSIPRETIFTQPAASNEEFVARLNQIADIANSDNLLLNDNLEATQKGGFHWIARVIMSPFSYLFCRDPFSDVRMSHVAEKLDLYLRVNQPHYANTAASRQITTISDRIVTRLKTRTHHHYDAILNRVLELPANRLGNSELRDRLQRLEGPEGIGAQVRAAFEAERAAWQAERTQQRDAFQAQQHTWQGTQGQLQDQLRLVQQELTRLQEAYAALQNEQAQRQETFDAERTAWQAEREHQQGVFESLQPEWQGARELLQGQLTRAQQQLTQLQEAYEALQNAGPAERAERREAFEAELQNWRDARDQLGIQQVLNDHAARRNRWGQEEEQVQARLNQLQEAYAALQNAGLEERTQRQEAFAAEQGNWQATRGQLTEGLQQILNDHAARQNRWDQREEELIAQLTRVQEAYANATQLQEAYAALQNAGLEDRARRQEAFEAEQRNWQAIREDLQHHLERVREELARQPEPNAALHNAGQAGEGGQEGLMSQLSALQTWQADADKLLESITACCGENQDELVQLRKQNGDALVQLREQGDALVQLREQMEELQERLKLDFLKNKFKELADYVEHTMRNGLGSSFLIPEQSSSSTTTSPWNALQDRIQECQQQLNHLATPQEEQQQHNEMHSQLNDLERQYDELIARTAALIGVGNENDPRSSNFLQPSSNGSSLQRSESSRSSLFQPSRSTTRNHLTRSAYLHPASSAASSMAPREDLSRSLTWFNQQIGRADLGIATLQPLVGETPNASHPEDNEVVILDPSHITPRTDLHSLTFRTFNPEGARRDSSSSSSSSSTSSSSSSGQGHPH